MMRMGLEDPMRAYKIIMNPQIRGLTLTPEEQSRLLDFIIRTYNLNMVRDMARAVGGVYENLQTIDLFEKADTLKFKFLGGKMKSPTYVGSDGKEQLGWVHQPGEYFDLIPGEKESDFGSYLQYVYNTNQNVNSTLGKGKHPNIKTLINASLSAKQQGLSEAESNNNQFVDKMEKDMKEYIRNRTSGERQNAAKDRRKKRAAEETSKKNLRESKLERIMNKNIFSLGLEYFDDVDFPNF